MDFNGRKFAWYIISILLISGVSFFVYEFFDMHEHHTSEVKLFCDDIHENVGVTNTRSVDMLKDYSHDKVKFDSMDEFKIENFYSDTLHIPRCSDGVLFSKRFNGARGIKVMIDGEEQVITVLTENITFPDGVE
ncbi:MAG: hypothetical protein ABJP45_01595 [Cyclobacteriaceae bacterium]